jgi:hypothetical protein
MILNVSVLISSTTTNFTGNATFEYTVSDGNGSTDTASVTGCNAGWEIRKRTLVYSISFGDAVYQRTFRYLRKIE